MQQQRAWVPRLPAPSPNSPAGTAGRAPPADLIAPALSLRARDGALRQGLAIAGDLARGGDPQIVAVRHDLTERPAKRAYPERLADDERVQRHCHDQRVFARLVQHLVELVGDHLGELPAGMAAE